MKHIYLILLLSLNYSYAVDNQKKNEFLQNWSSPLHVDQAQSVTLKGSGLTALVILGRKSGFDKFQEDMADDEPMGDLAHFGDYMGQLIPNLAYIGGMYWNYKKTDNKTSLNQSRLMFKTTFYSGLTTGILKRVVNQKRPHGGDRLSFPSGHTTTAFAFASIVGLEHNYLWGISAYSLAGIVGLSRMNDNAHYLHDVIFGATIGMAYGISLHHLQKKKGLNSNISCLILPADNGAFANLNFSFN